MTPNSLVAAVLTPTKRKICNCNLAIGGHVAQRCSGVILRGHEVGLVAVTMEHTLFYEKKFCYGEKKFVPTTCCMKFSWFEFLCHEARTK